MTIETLARRFQLEYVESRRLRAGRKYVQAITTHIVPNLEHVLADVLNREQVRELVKRTDNPASDMERNLPKKRARDRVLSLEESRFVWRAGESAGYAFGTHVQLMLLTGCRAGEWAKAQWRWVDLDQGLLVIPGDR